MMRPRLAASLALAVAALSACAPVRAPQQPAAAPDAPPPPQQPVATAPRDPPYDSDAADLEPGLAERLSTGRPFELVVEVEVTRPLSAPVRVPAGSCSVQFDQWDKVFRLRTPAGSSRQGATMTAGGVVQQCTDRAAYTAATSQLPPGATARRIVRAK